MKKLRSTALPLLLASMSVAALGACTGKVGTIISPGGAAGDDGQKPPVQASFTRFPDLPMPVKAEMDMGQTLIFGANDAWIGRMVLTSGHGPNDMFDFYKQEMPAFGWQEITSVRSDISVMTYTRGQRVATIRISGATLGGSKVTITASPRGAEEFPPPPQPPGVDQTTLPPPS